MYDVGSSKQGGEKPPELAVVKDDEGNRPEVVQLQLARPKPLKVEIPALFDYDFDFD